MSRSVPSKIYTKEYYLMVSEGAGVDKAREILSPRFEYMIDISNITKNDVVLDVGCGTGEFCLAIAKTASGVVGIDYSKDAIIACNRKRKKIPKMMKKTKFMRGDATKLRKYVGKKKFTKVFLSDVVEHLYPEQLHKALLEIKSLMTPEGTLYIHTAPNLEFYKYGYPVIRFFYPILRRIGPTREILWTKANWKGRRKLPKDPEEGSHNKMGHVNEQTPKSMKEALNKSGYAAKVKVLPFLRPVHGLKIRILYGILCLPVIKKMFGADIIAIARLSKK